MRIYKNNLQKVVNQSGFALPTVLIASMIMLGVLTFAAVSSSTVRTNLDDQYYNQLASTAADAGIEYAKACLGDETVPSWSADSPLRPGSDCNGAQLSGFACSDSSTDSRCFVVSPSLVEVLVVGGGGGGGGAMGGGGGAGGLLYSASMAVNAQTYTATVGTGGIGGSGSHFGTNGNQSSFNTLSALGGGGGGYYPGNTYHGKDGGSGGGGGGGYLSGDGGAGNTGQGNNGGAGNSYYLAGGGGGAGAAGQAGQSQVAGYGGNGLQYSISGTTTYYAGGGGGGGYWGVTSCAGGAGGLGGGGGGNCVNNGPGIAGTINTGGGGGGAGYSGGGGGTGGSGVVIVRYPSGSMVATGGNITYADSNGLNSRTVTPYPGGYTIHTFTTVGSGAFIVTSVNSGDNIISSTISSFSVGLSQVDNSTAGTGALAALSATTYASPYAIIISPDGTSAYVANDYDFTNNASHSISMYSRDTSTGALTALSPATIWAGSGLYDSQGITISPDGKSVYISNYYSHSISMYSRDTSTGALAALSTATITTTDVHPDAITVSADGKSVYATSYSSNSSSNTISMYSRDTSTGALAVLSPATIATGTGSGGITISPDGASVYVTNGGSSGSNTISMYSRDTSTGALAALSTATITIGTYADTITISPDGKSVYVINSSSYGSSNFVSMYSRNTSTGALAALSTATIATGGSGLYDSQTITISSDGKSVYVANSGSNTISMYSRDTSTGALAALSTATIATSTSSHPMAITISPDGKSVYVANWGSNSVSMYSRNTGTVTGTIVVATGTTNLIRKSGEVWRTYSQTTAQVLN